MYEVERKDKQVIIRKNGHAVYTASLDAYIIYDEPEKGRTVARVKDLTDDKLLLALSRAVEFKESD